MEDDPNTYKETITSKYSFFWNDDIQDEINSTMSSHTWELINLPKGSKLVGCKWVFRRKYHSVGTLNAYKAILVAKSFRQNEGLDEGNDLRGEGEIDCK